MNRGIAVPMLLVLLTGSVVAAADPPHERLAVTYGPTSSGLMPLSYCTYETGTTELVIAQVELAEPPGEYVNVGGCVFDPWTAGVVPSTANVLVTDLVGGYGVGFVVCTDVNFDGICGDATWNETFFESCSSYPMVEIGIGPPYHPAPAALAVYAGGPLRSLECSANLLFGPGSVGDIRVWVDGPPL